MPWFPSDSVQAPTSFPFVEISQSLPGAVTSFTNVELGFFSTPPRDEGEKEKTDLSALQDLEKIKDIH